MKKKTPDTFKKATETFLADAAPQSDGQQPQFAQRGECCYCVSVVDDETFKRTKDKRFAVCSKCQGMLIAGYDPDVAVTCTVCKGTGRQKCEGSERACDEVCPRCKGQWPRGTVACHACKGRGMRVVEEP